MQVLPRVQQDGSIVQLAERRSPKPKVGGSKPSAPAKENMEFVAQLVERQNVDLEVMGSSPIILPSCFNSSVGRAALL